MNAIFVWGLARAAGGRVLLRIEDHDRLRCRPPYEAALLEDLDWLGFVPDEGPSSARRGRAIARAAIEAALAALDRRGLVYACDCSRRASAAERYDGRCRHRGLRPRRTRPAGPAGAWTASDGPAEQCGDLLVRDRDGHWTYQFAVTVDDTRSGHHPRHSGP